MRDILIILLSVLFTLLVIILFDIKSMSQQFLTLIFVLLAFIIFYMAIDKIHIFKDSENEVNINNTSFSEEGELVELVENEESMEMELGEEEGTLRSEGQNLVEANDENYVLTSNDLINPNYSIGNVNTNNFGMINNKFVGDLI